MEGSLQRRFNQVVFGHGKQLWGLAVHPDDELFATAGHDKNIALWRKQKLLWTTQVPIYENQKKHIRFYLEKLFFRYLMNVYHYVSIHLEWH